MVWVGCACMGKSNAAVICKVTDPTGTPLNVRESPNGERIGTLRNGTKVEVVGDNKDSKGRVWAYILWHGQGQRLKGYSGAKEYEGYEGWVIREYLSCKI